MDKNTQDLFFVYGKFCRSLCYTQEKKVNLVLLVICTDLLLRIWSNSGGELTQIPVPFFLSEAKKKKKVSESSKLCSIAYSSCSKGAVFGSQMPVTESWLQAVCKAGGKSHQRHRQRSGQQEPRGWEVGKTHTLVHV